MIVQVRLFGTVRRLSLPDEPGIWRGEIPDDATIDDLINAIGSSRREVTTAAVDGNAVSFETKVPFKAEIVLVTAVGGG